MKVYRLFPSVLWQWGMGDRKGIWTIKGWVLVCLWWWLNNCRIHPFSRSISLTTSHFPGLFQGFPGANPFSRILQNPHNPHRHKSPTLLQKYISRQTDRQTDRQTEEASGYTLTPIIDMGHHVSNISKWSCIFHQLLITVSLIITRKISINALLRDICKK